MTDAAIAELTPLVGVRAACVAVGRPRATHYRRHRQTPAPPRPPRPEPTAQPRALSAAERAEVLDVLHDERFVDLAPGEVYAILLDEGRYLCSSPRCTGSCARPTAACPNGAPRPPTRRG